MADKRMANNVTAKYSIPLTILQTQLYKEDVRGEMFIYCEAIAVLNCVLSRHASANKIFCSIRENEMAQRHSG